MGTSKLDNGRDDVIKFKKNAVTLTTLSKK